MQTATILLFPSALTFQSRRNSGPPYLQNIFTVSLPISIATTLRQTHLLGSYNSFLIVLFVCLFVLSLLLLFSTAQRSDHIIMLLLFLEFSDCTCNKVQPPLLALRALCVILDPLFNLVSHHAHPTPIILACFLFLKYTGLALVLKYLTPEISFSWNTLLVILVSV